MKILITGGAGYIGNILITNLVSAKLAWSLANWGDKITTLWSMDWEKITVIDNLRYNQVCLTDYCYRGDFDFVYGDVRDHEKLLPYVLEADVIIPLAAIVGFPACEKDKTLATQINYEHVKFICENAKPSCKIIYPNTNSGYGIGEKGKFCTEETPLNPISHYGVTKCLAEKCVLDRGGISLRLATVFGVSPRMRLDLLVNDFTYKAVKDGYIVLFEKDFKRNFIHVRDVAKTFMHAIIKYADMQGQAYNVGLSTANLSKLELAYAVKQHVPNFSIQSDDIKSDPDKRDYIVSNAKLEKTNWVPYYKLDDGIRELIKAYKIVIPTNKLYTNL